jgi:DNA polymerase phi
MRNGSIPKDDEWVNSILELFIIHGLFVVTKKNNNSTFPAVSSAMSTCCVFISFPALATSRHEATTIWWAEGYMSSEVVHHPWGFVQSNKNGQKWVVLGAIDYLWLSNNLCVDEAGQTARMTSSATDGELWITKAIKTIERLEQDTTHVSPLVETEDDVTSLRVRARKVLKILHKVGLKTCPDCYKTDGCEWLSEARNNPGQC